MENNEWLVRICVAVSPTEGYWGSALTPKGAEDVIKSFGSKLATFREHGRIVRLPSHVSHFTVDGMGSVSWKREHMDDPGESETLRWNKETKRWE